jgi:tRNA U34 2-thiouridine synthase MnmA/TrmU
MEDAFPSATTPRPAGDRHCIALLSGGLDSILAVHLMLDQGVRVTALQFMTHFGCDGGMGGSCSHDQSSLARRSGFEIKLCHLGQDYIDMVRNPAHGYGSNMNPCIDCRMLMLNWAKDYMRMAGALFLVTGEVLDQRPMSQRRHSFKEIDRLTGLEGLVLRPLSARLLDPTVPERNGWVDRARLGNLSGRSRKPQLEMAKRFNITEIPQPAGGCLLTDPGYSVRLRDLFQHVPHVTPTDLNLLRVGRRFRLSLDCLAIVGRDHEENLALQSLAEPGDVLIDMDGHLGPLTLLRGRARPEDVALAGGLTAAYSKPPQPNPARVRHGIVPPSGEPVRQILAVPLPTRESFAHLRIGDVSAGAQPVRRVDRIEV